MLLWRLSRRTRGRGLIGLLLLLLLLLQLPQQLFRSLYGSLPGLARLIGLLFFGLLDFRLNLIGVIFGIFRLFVFDIRNRLQILVLLKALVLRGLVRVLRVRLLRRLACLSLLRPAHPCHEHNLFQSPGIGGRSQQHIVIVGSVQQLRHGVPGRTGAEPAYHALARDRRHFNRGSGLLLHGVEYVAHGGISRHNEELAALKTDIRWR